MTNFVNLTPHELNIKTEDGNMLTIPASGDVARLTTETVEVGEVGGVTVRRTVFGDIEGLPASAPNTIYIVSALVMNQAQRADVLAPGTLLRDSDGKVIGCDGLSTICDFVPRGDDDLVSWQDEDDYEAWRDGCVVPDDAPATLPKDAPKPEDFGGINDAYVSALYRYGMDNGGMFVSGDGIPATKDNWMYKGDFSTVTYVVLNPNNKQGAMTPKQWGEGYDKDRYLGFNLTDGTFVKPIGNTRYHTMSRNWFVDNYCINDSLIASLRKNPEWVAPYGGSDDAHWGVHSND